jgi:hypothetical protein
LAAAAAAALAPQITLLCITIAVEVVLVAQMFKPFLTWLQGFILL